MAASSTRDKPIDINVIILYGYSYITCCPSLLLMKTNLCVPLSFFFFDEKRKQLYHIT